MKKINRLELCIKSALAGGDVAQKCKNFDAENKESSIGAIHSIAGEADYLSHQKILNILIKKDPLAYLITEEHMDSDLQLEKIISKENLSSIKNKIVYVIDELDGSSSHNVGHYEWSISVGCIQNLVPICGAIYAPRIFGGALFYSSLDQGAFLKSKNKTKKLKIGDKKLEDSYIIFGADCVLDSYPKHQKLMCNISNKIRTTNMNGSCALPLGLVASGNVDALIQPLQSPWDYTAGISIVKEAGGEMLFYEMDKSGNCFFISDLELKHYDPSKKNVGFVAGNYEISHEILDRLIK